MAVNSSKYFPAENGRIKVQFETLNPGGGWKFQSGSNGDNPGFQGSGYYYWKSENVRDYDRSPTEGLMQAKIFINEPGTYNLRVRSARDISNPGDARNDIWMKVDGSTNQAVPKSFNELVSKNGFAKLYKAQAEWGFADRLGTYNHNDRNPDADIILDKGFHTITFAGRSNGFHIDYFELYKGGAPSVNAANTKVVGGSTPPVQPNNPGPQPEPNRPEPNEPEPKPSKPEPNKPGGGDDETVRVEIRGANNDWEGNKGAPSDDLEFGRDGSTSQKVGLRFDGIDIEKGADIESAYFVFEARETSTGAARFEIEIENDRSADAYRASNDPNDRSYIGQDVDWNVTAWKAGQDYRSPDISKLIEAVVKGGDLDALAFRISGTGERVAHASESGSGAAPQLVINYDEG